MTPLDYGRLLMAFTLGVHSMFIIVGVGLALFISLAAFLVWRGTRREALYALLLIVLLAGLVAVVPALVYHNYLFPSEASY